MVHVRLSRAGQAETDTTATADVPSDPQLARFLVLFELEHSPEAQAILSEVDAVVRGGRSESLAEPVLARENLASPRRFASETQLAELGRLLDEGIRSGRIQLELERPNGTHHERQHLDLQPPPLPPAAPEAAEPSFIAVRLVEKNGNPLADHPVQIELPDGSVHRGFTDANGFARVSGFTQDGDAKITFPGFDERDFKTKSGIDQKIIIPVVDGQKADAFAGLKDKTDDLDAEAGPDNPLDADDEGDDEVEPVQTTPATFSLIVLDDVGGPVPGANVTFELPTGVQSLTTDDSGVAKVDNVMGPVRAAFDNVNQLRQVLRPRFISPDRQPQPFDDVGSVVKPLSELFDPLKLKPDKPLTLLLTPSIECHEVPGANFDFGRSYVRSTAINQLAAIAEALRNTIDQQAMIFGHTDLSGSEALNKELSERRAKAVFALLTHDSDAWEQLFSGTADGPNWQEKWDLEETQNMLNALGCTDDEGAPLEETGKRDEPTKQAIHRFQRGEFPDKPLEQEVQPESDFLGKDGRRLLFLAYAKRISRQPIAANRFFPINGSLFMGCGEFNALSLSAKDAASRRVNVFLFDPVAAPDKLPCKLRQLPPCQANLDPKPTALNDQGRAPFRCRVFQGIASKCTAAPSPDLSHDLVLSFPLQMQTSNDLAHKYTLEADDGTITMERTLADDARAGDDTFVQLAFEHLPENHRYRLTCDDGEEAPYTVFDFATLKELQAKFKKDLIAADLSLPSDFAQLVTTAADPVGPEDGSNLNADGTDPADDEPAFVDDGSIDGPRPVNSITKGPLS